MSGLRMRTLLFALGASLLCGVLAAEEAEDVTEPPAVVIPLTAEKRALDVKAPPSQFAPNEGERLWEDARQRASTALPEQGSGFFDTAERMPEGFRLARNFQSEDYTDGELASEMRMAITADQAERSNKQLLLTGMKFTVFIGRSMLDKPDTKKKSNTKTAKTMLAPKAPEPAAVGKGPKHRRKPGEPMMPDTSAASSALSDVLPIGGRVIISAPHAAINIETNEGHATGNVTIEVYPKHEAGKPYLPMAVMKTDHLNWRSWSEPSIGTTELAAYTCGTGNADPDPAVSGQFNMPQPDGTTATTLIEGHGLIFELGIFDRPDQVFDEDSRLAGINKTAHNRALFHKSNKMITTMSSVRGLIPYQNSPAPSAPTATAAPKTPEKKAEDPSRTEITCAGPALIDLAAVPRQKPPDNAAHTQILLCKRFEFLDQVTMKKVPVDPKTGDPIESATAAQSNMYCGALVMQYPPGVMPGPATFPEYAEAINNVTMTGTTIPQPTAANPNPAPAPFDIKCLRVFLDGPGDNTFLVGTDEKPVQIKHDRIDTIAQQFNFRSHTQTLVMPSEGPKRMIIHAPPPPATPAAPPPAGTPTAAGINMATGDTILNWTGTLTREMKNLPVPHQADRQEEVLTVKGDVLIEKPESGLRMRGDVIHIIRTEPEEDVIFIDGHSGIEVTTPEMRATGESFTVDMAAEPEKADPAKPTEIPHKQVVTVIGSQREKIKATAYMGGTAVRTEKFITDQIANTFHAFGGSVIVVKPPPEAAAAADKPKSDPKATDPKSSDAKPDAGGAMFKGVSFQPGATTWMQCDGEFSMNGDHTGTLNKNVIIKQPGMQILADDVYLVLQPPPPPPEDPNAPKDAKTPPPQNNSMAGGDLKSIDCIGTVEVMTDDQVIQCDRLFHDVEKDSSVMTMNDPDNDVRIYRQHDENGKTEVVTVVKSLDYDGKTGNFKPGGKLLILPYRNETTSPRAKDSSPARRKVAPAK